MQTDRAEMRSELKAEELVNLPAEAHSVPSNPSRGLGFNVMDRPRFGNPGANVSDLRLNPDGTVQNLNGFTEITGTQDGSEGQLRLGVRFAW